MKKRRRNQKRNIDQRKKRLIITFFPLILCCIIIPLFWINKINFKTKEIYQVESRIEKIKELKKKDTEDYKTIGWIKVQGTNIDIPVIAYLNGDLSTDLENYAWNLNSNEKFYNKINIRGHNILNLSSQPEVGLKYFLRFDDLMSFVYYDFAKKNKYIQYTVDGKDYIYKIFSVGFESSYYVDSYHDGKHSKKELKELIKRYKEISLYQYDIDVEEKDKFISLITCTRFNGFKQDFIVNARLVRENEKLTDYSIKTTKEYKEVKKVLEGEEKNERA